MLFKECQTKRAVENKMIGIFKSRGFSEVVTPSFEFYDVFAGQNMALPQEMMYKFFDSRGRILVLRPDNTTPIARIASTRLKGFQPPLRLYYKQNIFRISPAMTGRRDELTQCGIELIGAKGRKSDLEVIQTAVTTLKSLSGSNYRFEIGHVGFFKSIIDGLPFEQKQKEQIREFVESKNYAELKAALEPFEDNRCCRALLELPRLFGGKEVFQKALEIAPNQESADTIRYLNGLYDGICRMGLEQNIIIDIGLVHQIDYYSGVVFRGYIQGSGESVVTGGRYDSLFDAFGAVMPAIGFAVNADAVAKNLPSEQKSDRPDVIIFSDDNQAGRAFAHMEELISQGLTCEMSVFDSLEETSSYARKKEIPRIDLVDDGVQSIDCAIE